MPPTGWNIGACMSKMSSNMSGSPIEPPIARMSCSRIGPIGRPVSR